MKLFILLLALSLVFTVWACNSIDEGTGLSQEQLRKINS